MKTVLFVDDEPMILKCIERSLRGEPYKKIYARNAEEALELLKAHAINVLVTDMNMPGINGLDLLKAAKTLYPHIGCILLSGNFEKHQIKDMIKQDDCLRLLQKPWDVEGELKPAIRKAIRCAQV
jgi:CheY-like chemotaxis protein